MSKGNKQHGNREAKKPKASKPAPAHARNLSETATRPGQAGHKSAVEIAGSGGHAGIHVIVQRSGFDEHSRDAQHGQDPLQHCPA